MNWLAFASLFNLWCCPCCALYLDHDSFLQARKKGACGGAKIQNA